MARRRRTPTDTPNYARRFAGPLAALTADLPEPQREFIREHPKVAGLQGDCAKADNLRSDPDRLGRMDTAAATANGIARLDARLRNPEGGRPLKTDEQTALEEYKTALTESAAAAETAINALPVLVQRLADAWTKAQDLNPLAARQRAAVEKMLGHLDDALAASQEAFGLWDEYTTLAKSLADALVPTGPGCIAPTGTTDAAARMLLEDTIGQVRMSYGDAMKQVEKDTAHARGELTLQEEQAKADGQLADFQARLKEAARAFRKTPEGKKSWQGVGAILSGRAESSPLHGDADATTQAWWQAVAEFANIEIPAPWWLPAFAD